MEFRLLGRLEAEHEGRPIALGRRRERCLLGVLLLEPNSPIPVDRLVDLLWDTEAPATARANVHTHVSRLRALLDPDGTGGLGVRLRSHRGGYLVEIDPYDIDAYQFQRLVERARTATPAGRIDLLRQALALWRGPVLADVVSPRLRERIAAELAELRMSATELVIDAGLTAGRHQELIGELSTLNAEHPYRERLAGQLMLAQYRSDRYAEALVTYQRLRDRLAEDLGVDPGSELSALHAAILRRDPWLSGDSRPGSAPTGPESWALPSGAPRSPEAPESEARDGQAPDGQASRGDASRGEAPDGDGARQRVPQQLPAATRLFIGRTDELNAMTKMLTGESGRDTTAVISAIGGTGKTWLALHWAHQHLDRFPDGQLFVNLRGFDPSGQPMTPETAIRGFLDALGVAPTAIPPDPDAQLGLYRSLTSGRRILVVLDNARDSSQVSPLLPGSASCTVLITSRDRLAGLVSRHGALPVPLDTLGEAEARELLARRLGEERLAGEPEAVAALVGGCAGLPLALAIAASRAAIAPQLPLAVIAAELRDATTRLGALDSDDPEASLRAVLSWSYAALRPARARVLGLLGSAGGPDIGLPAAAALTGLPAAEVATALDALERHSLVQQHSQGRWRMHDLIRLYAAERVGHDPDVDVPAALRRLVDFYLHTACAADRLLSPARASSITLDEPAADAAPVPLTDSAEAQAWLDREHACVFAAQRLAQRQGWHEQTWQLAWSLTTFSGWRGHLHDLVAAWHVGLTSARQIGDPGTRAMAHRQLGRAYVLVGRHAEATEQLRQSLRLAEQAGNLRAQAGAHWGLAWAWEHQGDDERALEHATEALRLYRACGDQHGEGGTLNIVGWYASRLGRYDEARTYLEAALALSRQVANRLFEANTLDSLGHVAHHTGRYAAAVGYYEDALAGYRDLGNAYEEADTLERLGDTHAATGDDELTRRAWRQALRLFRELGRTPAAERIQGRLAQLDQGREPAGGG